MKRLISLALLLVAPVWAAACGDDVDTKSGTADCAVGETLNPVTGVCTPRVIDQGDMGTTNNGSTNNGSTNNGSTNNGSTNNMTTPDMGGDMGPECQTNERRCVGDTVEICSNGTFIVRETCGDGFFCELGNCVPDDINDCTPGETRCAGDSGFQTCNPDGMSWSTTTACSADETCQEGQCTTSCAGFIDKKSNVGCEYITMRHHQATGLQVLPHSVVVSNPSADPVTVQVSSPGGINPGIPQQTIQPNDSAILNFPTSPMVSGAGISQNLYVIESSRPVIATQFSPLNNPGLGSETSDASLLLPTNALGNEYVVLGWRALQPGGTYVDIVANEPNTTVTVSSPLPLTGGTAGNVAANSTTTFTVGEKEVLHLAENRSFFDTGSRDVSGVTISSDKPIAVYTGATIVNIPDEPVRVNPPAGCITTSASCTVNNDCCSGICGYDTQTGTTSCMDSLSAGDHVEQQLFPVEAWGSSYLGIPFPSRGPNDFTIFRVVGATDGTAVTLDPPVNGESSFTINRGEVKQIYGTDSFELTATNPVMLAQFMIGGSNSSLGDGDPAFLIPPAEQQFRDAYVFLVPGQYDKNRVTIIKETTSQVTLDGNVIPQASFTSIGGGSMWQYATIDSLTAGVHQATSGEAFGIIVHGVDEYISYAFAGGITLPE